MSEVAPADTPRKFSLPVLAASGKAPEPLRVETPKAREPGMAAHANRPPRTGRLPAEEALESAIVAELRQVYDPEIPVNVYDLGLIYEIKIGPENVVKIKMTLTAPGCPVAGILPGEVESRVENVAAVKSATVELVWDPPWSRDMLSEAAKLELGMF